MNQDLLRLFDRLPLEKAMPELVPSTTNDEVSSLIETALQNQTQEVQAALWLYVDDLDRSHAISQGIESPTGSFWHGIMHRREGDFSNAKYWFRRVGGHPLIDELRYDPFLFIDECAKRYRENPAELVEMQRKEWKALFDWCMGGTE